MVFLLLLGLEYPVYKSAAKMIDAAEKEYNKYLNNMKMLLLLRKRRKGLMRVPLRILEK